MSDFNIVRIACGVFFCDCQKCMCSLIADSFHTVFGTFDIFFYDRLLFKRLLCRTGDRRFQFFFPFHSCDPSAAGAVCRFHDHRISGFLNRNFIVFSCNGKERNPDSGSGKGFAHFKFVCGVFNTFPAVPRKSKFFGKVLNSNIGKVWADGRHRLRPDFSAHIQNFVFLRDADLVKIISIFCSGGSLSPCKNMSLISHFVSFYNQRFLKIICTYDHNFFHGILLFVYLICFHYYRFHCYHIIRGSGNQPQSLLFRNSWFDFYLVYSYFLFVQTPLELKVYLIPLEFWTVQFLYITAVRLWK